MQTLETADDTMNIPPPEAMTPLGWLGLALGLVIYGLFLWYAFKWVRGWIKTPQELAGIRQALERIADQLEKRD